MFHIWGHLESDIFVFPFIDIFQNISITDRQVFFLLVISRQVVPIYMLKQNLHCIRNKQTAMVTLKYNSFAAKISSY